MQISSTLSSAASATGASLVDQMKQKAAALADGSGASDDQKLDAYLFIQKAIVQSASSGTGWFQQSTQADRDAINAVMDGSSMAKTVRQAADDFNARGMRADRETNVMAGQISYLDGLSDFQQRLIFAGSASLEQTDTVDGWKAFLQRNADGRAQQLADENASVKVTLSDQAKAALDDQTSAPDKVAPMPTTSVGTGVAEAALRMLREAADVRADARAKADKTKADRNDATPIDRPGRTVDTSA